MQVYTAVYRIWGDSAMLEEAAWYDVVGPEKSKIPACPEKSVT
jgi:hypothetical protein